MTSAALKAQRARRSPRDARRSQALRGQRQWKRAEHAAVVADVLRWLRNVVLVPRERGP